MPKIDYCPVYKDPTRRGEWITGTHRKDTADAFVIFDGEAEIGRYPISETELVQARVAAFMIE